MKCKLASSSNSEPSLSGAEWPFRRYFLFILILILFVCVGGLIWQINHNHAESVKRTAIANAKLIVLKIATFRTLYTDKVVNEAQKAGLTVSPGYRAPEHARPIPEALNRALAKEVGSKLTGATSRLYSAYPYPWQQQSGLRDAFSESAWTALSDDPKQPFYRFEKLEDKHQAVLRYAVADRLSGACLACHNQHPRSPKKDWKVGETRGVLEIIYPLAIAESELEAGVQQAMGVLIALLVVFVCVGMVVVKYRQITLKLEGTKEQVHGFEEELCATLSTITDGVITTDRQGCIVGMNPVAERFTGYRAAEVLGRPIRAVYELAAPDNQPPVTQRVETTLASGIVTLRANHGVLISRQGQQYQVSDSAAPILDSRGEVSGVVLVFRDETQIYADRNKVEASEVRYKTLFERSADALLIIDEGRFIDCNEAAVNMLRYKTKEALLRVHPSELSPEVQPDGQSSFSKANQLIELALSKGSLRFEWDHRRADGDVFPVEVLLTSIPSNDRNILHVVWRDITERKQAELALKHSEVRFRDFADSAADWFWEMGPDLRFTYISGKIEEVIGLAKEEVIGKNRQEFYSLKAATKDPKWQRHLECIQAREPFTKFEVDWLRPDGAERIISLSGQPYFDNDERFMGYRGVGSDITDHKKRIEEVRRLRNYLRNIIDSMPSILIGVDGKGRITQWNSEAEDVTGIDAETAMGKPLERAIPRLSRDMDKVRRAIQTREELIDTKRSFKSGDETRYEDVTIYPLISNGVEGAVIRIDDVTEQVQLEEMMIQSEKMLSVGGLAAGMAHEINNPLAGMMQTANVLKNRLTRSDMKANREAAEASGTDFETIHRYMERRGVDHLVDTITDSGRRVASIVSNMLSFARKSNSECADCDLIELLDKTIALASTDYDLKKQQDFRDIHITREYGADIHPVPCEGAKIQQVLLNLLRNGAQAMQEAKVENPSFIIRVLNEDDKSFVRVEIEDNGPGMDDATRKRIFEPFYTTKPTGIGTGLGLSVSYFIITENHGGELSVRSKKGKGACFSIRLPTTEGKEV